MYQQPNNIKYMYAKITPIPAPKTLRGGATLRALSKKDIDHSFCNITMVLTGINGNEVTSAYASVRGVEFIYKTRSTEPEIKTNKVGGFNAAFTNDTPLKNEYSDYVLRISHTPMDGEQILRDLPRIKNEYVTQTLVSKMKTTPFIAYNLDGNPVKFNGAGADYTLNNLAFPVHALGVFASIDMQIHNAPLNRNYHIYSVMPKSTAGDLKVIVERSVQTARTPANKDLHDTVFLLVQIAVEKSRQVGSKYMLIDNKCENVIVDTSCRDVYLMDFDNKFVLNKNSTFPGTTIVPSKAIFQHFNMMCLLCSIMKILESQAQPDALKDHYLYSYAVKKLMSFHPDFYSTVYNPLYHAHGTIRDVILHYGYDQYLHRAQHYQNQVIDYQDHIFNFNPIVHTPPNFVPSTKRTSSLPSSQRIMKTVRKMPMY